ncbi:MAG: BTAD domain-containing putative transcriptional regulator [Chloroflexota bacterium]
MSQLNLSFFGSFQATLNQIPITNFRSTKVQGLLIYLVLASDQGHARDELAALFWPDEPDSVARKNLRQALYRLRQLLGDIEEADRPFLLISRTTVQWNQSGQTSLDVTDFLDALDRKAFDKAVSHYTGDLLPTFRCDSESFDRWLQKEREQLIQLNLNALTILTDQRLEKGDFQSAKSLAQRQLTQVPWREKAHRQLIQAYMLAGERGTAIAQYERCRAILAEELGIEPTAETKQLAKQIRHALPAPTARPRGRQRAGQQQLKIPFVGRQTEFARLTSSFQRMRQAGFQAVTVMGKAGIVKTRLSQQFLTWASTQRADLLRGRSFETSTGLSYQPIIDLFRQRLEQENAPEDLLSDFWLAQLTRLLPELRDRYPDLPPPTQDEVLAKQHLFEAVTRLGQALADRRPLLLFIEDWHWADPASLDLLQYAAARWAELPAQNGGNPILLLLTLRQEAITPEVQRWLTRFMQTVSSLKVELSELSQPETLSLLEALLTSEEAHVGTKLAEFSEWLYVETGGQPLFLAETLKALADDQLIRLADSGRDWEIDWVKLDQQRVRQRALSGVQTVIRGWIDRLSDDANLILTAVSVLEQEASFDHIQQVAGLDELQVIEAIDELLERQLLLEERTALSAAGLDAIYSFSHQKISEVVYAETSTARQRLLHRRAYLALQAAGAPAGECAHHARRAGLVAETVHYSLKAAQEAMSALATRVALTHYETAWQLVNQRGWSAVLSNAERETLFLGLGHAYEVCDQAEQARDVYEEMIAFAQQNGVTSMEWRGLNRLAELYNMALLDADKAFAALEQAWLVAEQSGDRRGMAETAQLLSEASSVYELSDGSEWQYAQQALALANELEDPHLLASCSRRLAYVCIRRREWATGEKHAAIAQIYYEEIGNFMRAIDSQRLLGMCQMQTGFPQQSLETLKKASAFTQQIENEWEQAVSARFMARTLIELGQYGQAIQSIREAIEKAEKVNHPIATLIFTAAQITYRAVFAFDTSQEAGLACINVVAAGGYNPFPDLVHAELCAVRALKGEWDAAYHHAKEVLAFQEEKSLPPMGNTGWFETEALLRGGDGDLARTEVERVAQSIGSNRRYHLPLLRSRAVLAQWDGDVVQAIEYLNAALALAREMGLPGEEWPILGELGKLYGEQGQPEKAQEAYAAAAKIIQRLTDSIDDPDLRSGFLNARQIKTLLSQM